MQVELCRWSYACGCVKVYSVCADRHGTSTYTHPHNQCKTLHPAWQVPHIPLPISLPISNTLRCHMRLRGVGGTLHSTWRVP